MKSRKILSIFVSSPADVSVERDAVSEVVEEINKIKGKALGYEFETIKWETDVLPTFGDEPQEIIDSEVGEDYDLFVGIMSSKFGTPTARAQSGTQHEFEKALEIKQSSNPDLEILFYFQKPGHSGRDIVASELQKVEDFKSKIRNIGLRSEYTTTTDFRNKLTNHLSRLLDRFVEKSTSGAITTAPVLKTNVESLLSNASSTSQASEGRSKGTQAFLDELEVIEDDDEELGYLDIADQAFEGFSKASEILATLNSAMNRMSGEVSEQAKNLQATSENAPAKESKAILSKSARSMDTFVETGKAVLPLLEKHMLEGIQGARGLVIVMSQDTKNVEEAKEEITAELLTMKSGMTAAVESFNGLSQTLTELPRASADFNKSKRKTKVIIEGISSVTEDAIREVGEILDILL